jgi:drug/metabolite transporter (DMT)-like permease
VKYIEKHPVIMIIVGILGISVSSILVRYSSAPSALTAAWRLVWTVLMMTPVVFGKASVRKEMTELDRKTVFLSVLSGVFLAIHFAVWFESLLHTSVASSTTIVCTEVIWVSLGYCLFLKGKLGLKAVLAIAVTLAGSIVIALADSSAGQAHLYGDILALAAAVAVAAYTLLGRIVRGNTSTTVYTYIVYTSCALVLIMVCIVQGYGFFEYGFSGILVGALLAFCSTILGHSIFSWCLKYFTPSFVSASKLCEPVVAAALAAVLFGERMYPVQLLGGGLILGGVLYYSGLEQK